MISCHFVKKKMVLKSPFLEKNDLKAINEQIQNIAQKKDTLCRRMYN